MPEAPAKGTHSFQDQANQCPVALLSTSSCAEQYSKMHLHSKMVKNGNKPDPFFNFYSTRVQRVASKFGLLNYTN